MGSLVLTKNRNKYEQVASLHVTMIPDGFLSSLGERFLSLLYEGIDKSEKNFLDVALDEDGDLIGFVAGGSSYSEVYFHFFRNPYRFTRSLTYNVSLLFKVMGIFEILFRTIGGRKETKYPTAELYSIAVTGSRQRGGIAKSLFENLVDYFAVQGYCSFDIRVGASLSNAHAFYSKQGAVKQHRVTFHGSDSSIVYRYFIKDAESNTQY